MHDIGTKNNRAHLLTMADLYTKCDFNATFPYWVRVYPRKCHRHTHTRTYVFYYPSEDQSAKKKKTMSETQSPRSFSSPRKNGVLSSWSPRKNSVWSYQHLTHTNFKILKFKPVRGLTANVHRGVKGAIYECSNTIATEDPILGPRSKVFYQVQVLGRIAKQTHTDTHTHIRQPDCIGTKKCCIPTPYKEDCMNAAEWH